MIKGQVRKDKFENLKKSVKIQQSLYVKSSRYTISNVKLRFKIKDAIAKGGWSFGNGKFIKECMRLFLDKYTKKRKIGLKKELFLATQSHERLRIVLMIFKMCLKRKQTNVIFAVLLWMKALILVIQSKFLFSLDSFSFH